MHDYLTLEIGIESNTAMKYIKNTKHVIKTAVERGWLLTNPISGFKCSYIDPDRDILDELQLMWFSVRFKRKEASDKCCPHYGKALHN
ncbi:MAG: hypothetical protein C0154_04890 [Mucilaginibacter sp.]|nr:MAG: hypothetical protein C0154_04890 [Mucilaginibacter sp.]PMP64843.1 MAG: hypothetical protein C0191_05205 [Mucilaginibacter sp.]HEK20257.1 hypothetical protein [Bacteroidota bacterium]